VTTKDPFSSTSCHASSLTEYRKTSVVRPYANKVTWRLPLTGQVRFLSPDSMGDNHEVSLYIQSKFVSGFPQFLHPFLLLPYLAYCVTRLFLYTGAKRTSRSRTPSWPHSFPSAASLSATPLSLFWAVRCPSFTFGLGTRFTLGEFPYEKGTISSRFL
jgi:hypothetical protein